MENSTLKLFAFVLLLGGIFFVAGSRVLAQCGPCSGNNKVRVTKITYLCPPYGCEVCKTKCVSQDQVQKYYEQGWIEGSGCFGHGCGGNGVNGQLKNEALPMTVSIDPSSKFSTISFSLAQSGKMSLNIFDMTGKILATIANDSFKDGAHEISWNTKGLCPGIYLLQAESRESIQTAKIVVPN